VTYEAVASLLATKYVDLTGSRALKPLTSIVSPPVKQ